MIDMTMTLTEVIERHIDNEEDDWGYSWDNQCRKEAWDDKQFLIDKVAELQAQLDVAKINTYSDTIKRAEKAEAQLDEVRELCNKASCTAIPSGGERGEMIMVYVVIRHELEAITGDKK